MVDGFSRSVGEGISFSGFVFEVYDLFSIRVYDGFFLHFVVVFSRVSCIFRFRGPVLMPWVQYTGLAKGGLLFAMSDRRWSSVFYVFKLLCGDPSAAVRV